MLPLARRLPTVLPLLVAAVPVPAQGAQGTEACVWTPVSPAPVERFEGVHVVIDDALIVFGGFTYPFPGVTSRVDRYDPATDTWTQLADLPAPFNHAPPAVDGREVWFAGGFAGSHPGAVTSDVWVYDVDADAWSAGPSLPAARGGGALVRVDRELHYFGGVLPDRDTGSSDHWVLDLDAPSGWTSATPMPSPRNHLSAVALGGKVYALGGQVRHDTSAEDTALAHVYDPATDAWTALDDLPFPRSHAEPGTFVQEGRIVLCGGKSSALGLGELIDSTAYDPATGTWSVLPSLPKPLLAPAVAVVGDLVVASSGGTGGLTAQSATYVRAKDAVIGDTLRVNAGGDAYTSAATLEEWCSDHGFRGSTTFRNDAITDIAGTDDDELYVVERYSTGSVPEEMDARFPVDPGLYRVRLHLAEIYWGAPTGGDGGAGKRVFDVWIEGKLALDDYDGYAEVGPMVADERVFDVEVADHSLDLFFQASANRAKVNALEVTRLPGGSFERYCSSTPNSTGEAARIAFNGSVSVAENNLVVSATPVPDQPGLFLYGPNAAEVPFGNGLRCVGGQLVRLPVVVASGGEMSHAVDYGDAPSQFATIDAGETWHFQAWFRDPTGGGAGFDLSDGMRITFTP